MSTPEYTADAPIPFDRHVNSKLVHELVDVTPELASKWLGQNHGNRNLRTLKVNAYARDMRNGNWMTSGDSIKFDWNDRLIDGQHRLEAVIESGTTIRVLVVWGVEPRVQDVLDVNVRRSPADALKFNGVEHHHDMIAAVAKIANARALGHLQSASSTYIPDMTNNEIVAWAAEHPEIADIATFANHVYKNIGGTPSVIAYSIWRLEQIDAESAAEFFLSMSEMRTNGPTDPRYTLLQTLNRTREQRQRLTPALQLRYIFSAWNAWRSNRPLSKLMATTSVGGKTKGTMVPEPK